MKYSLLDDPLNAIMYVPIANNFLRFYFIFIRERHVAAIDINMGCPKEFSIKVMFIKVNYPVTVTAPPVDMLIWPVYNF